LRKPEQSKNQRFFNIRVGVRLKERAPTRREPLRSSAGDLARKPMTAPLMRWAALLWLLLPAQSMAEPVTLKLAYFSSDRTFTYQGGIKPFVDSVNNEGSGVVTIEPHVSGALGKDVTKQLQLVLDGTADLAFVVIGMTPDRFAGTAVIELPGLFRNGREATLVYTRLIATNRLRSYGEFFVIGAFATDPESIHTRPPVATLADLNGLRIRVNNAMGAAALDKLGIKPVLMPINQAAVAIGKGTISGSMVSPHALLQFGIGRIATYHYMLNISAAPLALLMTRKRFDSLPRQAQDTIRKYSGSWLAERYSRVNAENSKKLLDQLRHDPKRRVVFPSPSDLKTADAAFNAVREQWAARAGYKALLEDAQAEIRKLQQVD
jgi:TRAP-type C4-dicarboxylate transport system substrate-binding protein